MTLQINRAEPADAVITAMIGRITFAETFGYLFQEHKADLRAYLDRTFDVGKIERSLGQPRNVYWLARWNRLPVGYAKLKLAESPPGQPGRGAAQLQKIYVLHEFLGQRIGHRLLDAVTLEATGRAPLLWLDVLRENARAIDFYGRHGFISIGQDTYTIGAQRFAFELMAREAS
jgi:ribosomal protein S18 acetylase RimI-like enzyme